MNEHMPKWYVVRPTIRGDWRASVELDAGGVQVFLPTFKRFTIIKHTKGQMKESTHLLMPGYLFVKVLPGQVDALLHQMKADNSGQRQFRHLALVVKPAGSDRAIPVPTASVEQLQYLCADGIFDQGKRNGDGFISGDRVLIVGGPLEGLLATYKDGRTRPGFARVVLDRMFGTNRLIKVEDAFIQAA